MEMEWDGIIKIVTAAIAIAGTYWKLIIENNKLKSDISKMETKITDNKAALDEFKDLQPACNKKFEDLHLDIEKIKLEDSLKSELQGPIIEKILQPVVQQMQCNLTEYIDIKMRLVITELENMKSENMTFKGDMKSMLHEFKDHTEKSIDRLVSAIERKN